MLRGKLVEISTWEQNITSKWSATRSLHWPVDLPEEFTALHDVPLDMHTPVQYLRWLVALIGDLHQPLHWLRTHSYGKSVTLLHKGEQYSLLSLWEEYIPHNLPPVQTKDQLRAQYQELIPSWRHKNPLDLFHIWAEEVAAIVCGEVYGKLEVNHADGTRRLETPVHLTQSMLEDWIRLADRLTALAGQRLAFLFADMIRHKKHKSGSADRSSTSDRIISHSLRGRRTEIEEPPASNTISDERNVGL